MFALIYCHIKFIFNKHILIMSLLSFIIIFFLGIIQIFNIEYANATEKIEIYYSSVFPFCVMLSTIYGVFLFGYLFLGENEDYRKVIINNKLKYYLSKIIVIFLYVFILTLINELIIVLIGYFKTKIISTSIYIIFINILVSIVFYSMIAVFIVISFNNFNLLYLVFVLFVLSLSNNNILKYIIVSFDDIKLSCPLYYYLFWCFVWNMINLYLYCKKEI